MKKSDYKKEGKWFAIIGMVFAVLALIIFPIIFGPLAILMGLLAKNRGAKDLGTIAIFLGIFFGIIGMAVGAYIGYFAYS